MIVHIYLEHLTITGTIKNKDSLLNIINRYNQQQNISIKQKQKQRNNMLIIFTTPFLIDIFISLMTQSVSKVVSPASATMTIISKQRQQTKAAGKQHHLT